MANPIRYTDQYELAPGNDVKNLRIYGVSFIEEFTVSYDEDSITSSRKIHSLGDTGR